MNKVDNLISFILNYSEVSFTVEEIRSLTWSTSIEVNYVLTKLIQLKLVFPFWLKRWIYFLNKSFTYYDYLYFSQRIDKTSIIWWETSLAYFWVLKKKPSSCYSYILTNTGPTKEYYYKEFFYKQIELNKRLYSLWIVKSWRIFLYEAEKALLDCFYLENLKGKEYDDYGIFYSQLKLNKLLWYLKYYPKTIQEKVLSRINTELNIDLKLSKSNIKWEELLDNFSF